MFEILSLFSVSEMLVAAAVVIVVYVITFTVVFGTFVLLTRRRLPHLRHVLYLFRPRLRLWQSMAAIVVFGMSLEFVILAATSFRACRKAEDHARMASSHSSFVDRFLLSLAAGRSDSWIIEHYQELGRYHQRMSEKYYDVARHPWRPVSPDPPEPTLEEALQREMQKIQLIQGLLSATSAMLSALQSAVDLAYGVYGKATTAAGVLVAPR